MREYENFGKCEDNGFAMRAWLCAICWPAVAENV